jgi:hypothetical protein
MQDHLRQVGRTAEWRRDPRPDEDDMAVDRSQVGALHPEDHAANPLRMEKDARTAFDVKDVHRRLSNLTDNVLKQILILPEGTHLTPGQTYLDLAAPEQGEVVPGARTASWRNTMWITRPGMSSWASTIRNAPDKPVSAEWLRAR